MQLAALLAWSLALACTGAVDAFAQFNPERVYRQSEAVKQRYADPNITLDTPGFKPGRSDFTSHAEMMDFIFELQKRSGQVNVRILGHSGEGRAIPLIVLTEPPLV